MPLSNLSRTTILVVIGVILILTLVWQRANIMGLISIATLGKKLTRVPVDASGKTPVAPAELKAQAEKALGRSISADAFALAKMLASEGFHDNPLKRTARAWVAYNDLMALRKAYGWKDFTKLFTYSTKADQNGFFGLQEKGRRYASWADVNEGHIKDAEALIDSFALGNDPTGGATKFVDEKALGVQPGTEGKTIASLEKQWGLKGRRLDNSDFYVFG